MCTCSLLTCVALWAQVNSLAVNTTVGTNVEAMCATDYPPEVLHMLRAQQQGTMLHSILLQGPMNVRLVPE